MKLSELEGKRIALWGYGREGRATLAALRWHLPRTPLALLCPQSEASEALELGDPALYIFTEDVTAELLARFDVVIKSPGISPYHGAAAQALARGVRFTSGSALWFGENPDARTLCVTGTKGKSTTTALIAHLLRASGARTALAGNIGLPLLELLDADPAPDVWALELSSYQTRDAIAPEVAVVLNLFPEHLDWHGSEDRYVIDKLALVTSANPRNIVLNAADARLAAFGRSAALQGTASESDLDAEAGGTAPARLWWFNARQGWHTRGTLIFRGEDAIMDGAALPLPGAHNRGNLCAALTAIEAMGLEAVPLARHALSFRPLPHRLQTIGHHDGREYVNDSISTTPHASLAALDCHANRRVAIIVGGYDRGLDWSVFFERMSREPPLAIITMGQNGPQIAEGLQFAARGGRFTLLEAPDMPEAVRMAERTIGADGVVLLSPGAPSFPRYRDYVERGRHFAQVAGFDPDAISAIPGLGVA
ncbi:UDP-N-acetylmuramoyl-L-alanine--D-glutamate ligase [Denitratimonas sp. CY0512]|uniref:UDP-N-acetylmuramoyl-L-alanine--D-glutamate ligase n=1 Tax=Denitratimonas sp. CY0512 TaxID=3131940 RepID=UPI0030A62706